MALILAQVVDNAMDLTNIDVKAAKTGTWTNSTGRARFVSVRLHLSNLDGNGATFTAVTNILDTNPATDAEVKAQTVVKRLAAATEIFIESGPHLVKSLGGLFIRVGSTNGSDSAAVGTMEIITTDTTNVAGAIETSVTTPITSTTVFSLADFPVIADSLVGMYLTATDQDDPLMSPARRILSHTGGGEFTIDRPLPFTPAPLDPVTISNINSAEVNVTAVGGATPLSAADINTEVDIALADINLDHLMKVAVANNADMTVEIQDGSVICNLISKTSDTSTYVVADDSQEALSGKIISSNKLNWNGS